MNLARAILVVLVSITGWGWAQSLAAEAPWMLPEGRLQLVSGNPSAVYFVDLDRLSKSGDIADIWIYQVLDPGFYVGGKQVVQIVSHERIDCLKRHRHGIGQASFDGAGKVLVTMPAEDLGAVLSGRPHDFIARYVCDGLELPAENIVTGHAEAFRQGRILIRKGPPGQDSRREPRTP